MASDPGRSGGGDHRLLDETRDHLLSLLLVPASLARFGDLPSGKLPRLLHRAGAGGRRLLHRLLEDDVGDAQDVVAVHQATERVRGGVVGWHHHHLQLGAQLAHPFDQGADVVELGFVVGIGAGLRRSQLPLRLVELDLAGPHDIAARRDLPAPPRHRLLHAVALTDLWLCQHLALGLGRRRRQAGPSQQQGSGYGSINHSYHEMISVHLPRQSRCRNFATTLIANAGRSQRGNSQRADRSAPDTAMKIVVLGAGVIGVTTAYYLARAGHMVTVVDRQPKVAQETSFANAGLIAPGHAASWASPRAPWILAQSLL